MVRKKTTPPGVLVAIIDEQCGLCREFGALLRRMVGPDRLEVVACGSAAQRALAPGIPRAKCLEAFTVVEPSGTVLQGGEAAARAVALAPALAPFRWMVDSKAGKAAARKAYGAVQLLRRRD